MRVLVAVGGEPPDRSLEHRLTEWGFEPVVVANTRSFGAALQSPDAPPLAIVDWASPCADLCRRMRTAGACLAPLHLIVLGTAGKGPPCGAPDFGGSDFVAHPWDPDVLWARVRVGERIVRMQMELNRAREALERAPMQDPATGVLNARAIADVLQKECARSLRTGSGFSTGLVEIDPRSNPAAREASVDEEVTCAVARGLQSNLRAYDWIGRCGERQFLVIAPGSTGTREEGVYERLCNNIALEPVFTSAGLTVASVSIGVATSAAEADADALMSAAREALRQAVSGGRNQVAYFEP